ncbi:MAG: 50S ribosomal protein L15 [Desulfovermiculus sp.]|nr:50S ribosomal protein L15 [Desulfovermiculus sp.]
MKLHQLRPFASEKKDRKRRGRGPSSGLGCTAGKGHKGQRARAGSGPAPGFEGGQMPLVRRLPKRGFNNLFRVEYTVLNLERIVQMFPQASEITVHDLSELVSTKRPIKVLGRGEIDRKITITAHAFSKQAVAKIESAGGQAVALEG